MGLWRASVVEFVACEVEMVRGQVRSGQVGSGQVETSRVESSRLVNRVSRRLGEEKEGGARRSFVRGGRAPKHQDFEAERCDGAS